jgi:hypothetical protein
MSKLFNMFERTPVKQCVTFRNPTEGVWNNTPLSALYFSAQNIQIIQNGIRAGVYDMSNKQYVIGQQDCDTIKIIMHSIFLQYALNQPCDLPAQVAVLNAKVLDYAVKNVYVEAKTRLHYLTELGTMAQPMARPVASTPTEPKRTYEMPSWF